jgi:hypothetical protein
VAALAGKPAKAVATYTEAQEKPEWKIRIWVVTWKRATAV